MDILDNRNVTSKHLGRKGLHLNKAGSTRLAKKLFTIYRNFDGLWNTQMNLQREFLSLGTFLGHLLVATRIQIT